MLASTHPLRHAPAAWLTLLAMGGAPQMAQAQAMPEFIAGVHAPEDLEALPGGQALLATEFQLPGTDRPSRFVVVNLASRTVRPVAMRARQRSAWGDADCARPDPKAEFSGMGLRQVTLPGGQRRWRLLAVNQGSRIAIEAYELQQHHGEVRLTWQGCAPLPAPLRPNDVAPLPDGGFLVTIIGDARHFGPADGLQRLLSGEVTGDVLRADAAGHYRHLPGTAAPTPNGIVVDASGTRAWFAAWTGHRVMAYDLRTETITRRIPLGFAPDNLSLTPRGTVLAAGVPDVSFAPACLGAGGAAAACRSPFSVAELDPTLPADDPASVRLRVTAPAGVVGGATIAVELGQGLYIGAFTGEQLVRYAAP